MLQVSYKKEDRIGYYSLTTNSGTRIRVDLCTANCLWAGIRFHKDKEGNMTSDLWSFAADVEHLKRCESVYEDINDFYFYTDKLFKDEWGNDRWKAIKVIAKWGKTIHFIKR